MLKTARHPAPFCFACPASHVSSALRHIGYCRTRHLVEKHKQALDERRKTLRRWRRLAALRIKADSKLQVARAGVGVVRGSEIDVVAKHLDVGVVGARAARLDHHPEAEGRAELAHLFDELVMRALFHHNIERTQGKDSLGTRRFHAELPNQDDKSEDDDRRPPGGLPDPDSLSNAP